MTMEGQICPTNFKSLKNYPNQCETNFSFFAFLESSGKLRNRHQTNLKNLSYFWSSFIFLGFVGQICPSLARIGLTLIGKGSSNLRDSGPKERQGLQKVVQSNSWALVHYCYCFEQLKFIIVAQVYLNLLVFAEVIKIVFFLTQFATKLNWSCCGSWVFLFKILTENNLICVTLAYIRFQISVS